MTSPASLWPAVRLGDICTFNYGKALPEGSRIKGEIAVYGSNGVVGHHNSAITSGRTIIIGRKGSFGEVNLSEVPCWPIDTAYFVDEESTKADIRWLFHRLVALGLNKLNKAAAVPGLNREDAYRQQLLLPPIYEQRRIAAILDQAYDIRSKRLDALVQLDSLLQSIFIEMFGDPKTNPMGWEQKSLKNLGRVTTGGTPPSSKEGMFGGAIPFVTPGDLESNAPVKRMLSLAGAEEVGTVRAGATLVCCIGATIGKIGQASTDSAFNQQLNAVEWGPEIADDYGLEVMRLFKPTIIAWGASTTLPILKKSSFEQITIPVPPKSLQDNFAKLVAVQRQLAAKYRSSISELNNLFESLQARAFQGAL